MHHLSIGLDIYMNKNDNILFLGDFNSEKSENYLNHLRNVYNLQNIVKEATCFKNPDNPSYIDGKLRYSKLLQEKKFNTKQNTKNSKRKIQKFIQHKKYDNFNNNLFGEKLNNKLLNIDLDNAE